MLDSLVISHQDIWYDEGYEQIYHESHDRDSLTDSEGVGVYHEYTSEDDRHDKIESIP